MCMKNDMKSRKSSAVEQMKECCSFGEHCRHDPRAMPVVRIEISVANPISGIDFGQRRRWARRHGSETFLRANKIGAQCARQHSRRGSYSVGRQQKGALASLPMISDLNLRDAAPALRHRFTRFAARTLRSSSTVPGYIKRKRDAHFTRSTISFFVNQPRFFVHQLFFLAGDELGRQK